MRATVRATKMNKSKGTLNPIIDSSTEISSSFSVCDLPFFFDLSRLRSNYGVSSLILSLTLVIKVSNESISDVHVRCSQAEKCRKWLFEEKKAKEKRI
jgi:hypothetical protein